MKKLIFLLVVINTSMAHAGDYTGKAKINWLSNIRNDQFVMSGDWGNPMGCSQMNGNIWRMRSDNGSMDELKAMYSMALAAYMADKTIELYSHECGSDGRPQARSLYVPSRHGG